MISEWFNKHSLNFKLNASILICVCVGFAALTFFISQRVNPIIAEQIDALASKSVIEYAKEITHLVNDAEQIVINTKNTLSQTESDDISSLQMVLNSAIKTTGDSELKFTEAWAYTFNAEDVSKGTLYISENDEDGKINFREEKVDNFYSIFPWFKQVPKIEEIYWSEPYEDDITGNTVVTCLIPFMFKNQDDFDGLAAITIDLSSIQKNIYEFSFYESGRLLLVSRSGLYVTHPDPDISLKMTIFELAEKIKLPGLRKAGEDILQGKIGRMRIPYSSVYNGPAVFFYAPVKRINWGLFLVYSQDKLLKPIKKIQVIMMIALLIGSLLLLVIISQICSNSTNQLFRLSRLATKYGNGDFSESFTETASSSDIKNLANAFSNMRANLLEYTEKERKNAAEKQKSQSELEIARNIQKSALSIKYPKHDAFEISTTMIPARKVGGDFYDFFFIDDNRFALVMADVSGKGIPAALYMMKAQTLIRNVTKSNRDLSEAFQLINNELYEGNDTCMFVTTVVAVVNLQNGETEIVNAGHTPPLVYGKDELKVLKLPKNIVLGIKKNANFASETIKIKPDEHIFLYTDGVTEAENSVSQFYGEERLYQALSKAETSPEKNLNIVFNDIRKFAGENAQSDDIAMIDFAYQGNNTLKIEADNKKLRKLIDFLKEDMKKYNVDEKAQFDIITAAEEIFSNIADYAYESKENAFAYIKTGLKERIYYIEFSDNGKQYNPLKHKDPDVTTAVKDRAIGGLGILLAKKLSDKISYEYKNGFNVLTIEKSIHPVK